MNKLNRLRLLKSIAVSTLLLNTIGTSYAKPIFPFFNKQYIKNKTKNTPPPPKLSEIQIRNYSNTTNDRTIISTTPASALGYGYQKVEDNHNIEKSKINQSLIKAQNSAIEELLEKEEALQIHINRSNLPNVLEGDFQSALSTKEIDASINANQKEFAERDFYKPLNNNKIKTSIPLQVVVTEEVLTQFEIQSLEKEVMSHLNNNLTTQPMTFKATSTIMPISNEAINYNANSDIEDSLNTINTTLILPKILPFKKSHTEKILIANARENSEVSEPVNSNIQNNIEKERADAIPAFRKLMNKGIAELKSNQLNKADESFTKAQRMIPQSSAVYFYLGQVALKQQQPNRAESFARRGLSVSNDNGRNTSFWQMILRSAQMSNNKQTVLEAQKALL